MPETKGSSRRAAPPSVATERWGSGGRARLRCRHSTHTRARARERAASASLRSRFQARGRGSMRPRCWRDEDDHEPVTVRAISSRRVARGKKEKEGRTLAGVTRLHRRVLTRRGWRPCETRGAPRRRQRAGGWRGKDAPRERDEVTGGRSCEGKGGHSLRSLLRQSSSIDGVVLR